MRYETSNETFEGVAAKRHTLESDNGWFYFQVGGLFVKWQLNLGNAYAGMDKTPKSKSQNP